MVSAILLHDFCNMSSRKRTTNGSEEDEDFFVDVENTSTELNVTSSTHCSLQGGSPFSSSFCSSSALCTSCDSSRETKESDMSGVERIPDDEKDHEEEIGFPRLKSMDYGHFRH